MKDQRKDWEQIKKQAQDLEQKKAQAEKEAERREALRLVAELEEEERERKKKSVREKSVQEKSAEDPAIEKEPSIGKVPSGEKGAAIEKEPGETLDDSGKDSKDEEDSWKDLIYPEEGKEKHSRRRGRKKKNGSQKGKQRGKILLGVLLAALVIGAAVFLYIRYAPTRKHMDPVTYFEEMMSTGDQKATLSEDEAAIVMEDTVSASKALRSEGHIYLPYDLVREKLNARFFWDEENQMILYTTATETWEIPVNSSEYSSGEETRKYEMPILLSEERGLFVSADFLQQYTNVDYVIAPEEERHLLIRYDWGKHLAAEVKKETAVRYFAGVKGLILTTAHAGDKVRVLDTMKQWSRVVTPDGYIGYLQNKRITIPEEEEFTRSFEEPEYPSMTSEERLTLVWHMIGVQESNDYFSSDTEGMTGVDVISPTWFALSDNEGNISSLSSKSYVKKAHKAGLKVWGLVSNFSPDVSTTTVVNSTAARRNLVNNLIEAAKECKMDGINVDLEAITEDGAYGYVQFMREISVECRKNQLVLSVDVPVPFPFNTYYDRKELGTVADYVIIMGYDEHYAGSEAGTVASLKFEEDGITNTLDDVPAQKIMSGVPFYTRMWYTQTTEDGETSTWSEVLGMRAVLNTLESYGVTPEWDEEAQQYLASWTLDDGIWCRIWMEEETSLALKAELVKKYELGGVAAWALGNEIDEMWDVLSENIS